MASGRAKRNKLATGFLVLFCVQHSQPRIRLEPCLARMAQAPRPQIVRTRGLGLGPSIKTCSLKALASPRLRRCETPFQCPQKCEKVVTGLVAP